MKEMAGVNSRMIRMSILVGMLVLCSLFVNTAGASAHPMSARRATYGFAQLAADHTLRGGPGSHSSSSHATSSHDESSSSDYTGSHTTGYHPTYSHCIGSNCASGAFDFPFDLLIVLALIGGFFLVRAVIRHKRRADIPPYEPMD